MLCSLFCKMIHLATLFRNEVVSILCPPVSVSLKDSVARRPRIYLPFEEGAEKNKIK